MSMATPTVFEEKASYFNPTTKKWNSGTFTLQENCFRFQGDENNNKQNICIPLSTISGLEKRQSNLIFSCIVISVGSEKHWFSSFTNRDTVYNLLELFWRESLFSKSYRTSPSKPKDADTQIGKELLGILHESESTLVSAANALVNQGKQLQESQMVMEDINTDLTVAEKFLRTFNLTHSILGIRDSASKTDEALAQKEPESVQQKHYKVTFTFSKEINEGWEKGTLVISDEVVLLDEHQNRKIELNVDAIEKFLILTPWEFCLIYSSGWASKSCYIMNPRLSGLLKYLNSIPNLKNKIVYEENPIEDAPSCSSGISNDIQPKLVSPIDSIRIRSNLLDSNVAEMQTLSESGVISDGDIEEISNVLNNLKVLASKVSREQKHQMEQISSIITDVEKTELRVKEDIKNIKKVT